MNKIYNPGERVSIKINDDGNCALNGTKTIECIVLAVCGNGQEYLVLTENNMQSDAIVCAMDYRDPSIKIMYNVHENIEQFNGKSAAWIRPRFIVSKKVKTSISGEYNLNIQ